MIFKYRQFYLVALGLAFVMPIVFLLLLSFSQSWVYPNLLPQQISLVNWFAIFDGNNNIGKGLLNSFCIALTVALCATLSGFVCSKYIAYHKYRKQLQLLAYLPFALSPVIFALCIKYYFIRMGLVGNLLGIVLVQLIITFPYSVLFFIGFWNQSIKQYQNLVATLGGSEYYAIKKVVFPMAKSLLLVCFFQCFLISWFEFGLSNVLGYGKVQTLTLQVFQFIGEANVFLAALSSCLLVLPPVVLLWVNKKFILQAAK